MSNTATLVVELLGYWHPGTGRGDGVGADAVVNADADGLPILPGRTIKGLLRQAAELAANAGVTYWSASTITEAFGTGIGDAAGDRVQSLEESRFLTEGGRLRVASARLGKTLADRNAWASAARSEEGPDLLAAMRTTLASTALTDGLVSHGSLRSIEAWLPVTLYAELEWANAQHAPPWAALDEASQLFVRSVGSGRNRGLGRCQVSIAVGGIQ
jgi:hypothetical protein